MWLLRTEGLDEPLELTPFKDKEQAISQAICWYIDGYDADKSHPVPSELADETIRLITDLREGREFYSSRFHELVSLIEDL